MINPSLRLTKTVETKDSDVRVDYYFNYKVCYLVLQASPDDRFTRTKVVVYINGNVFITRNSYDNRISDPLSLPGLLVDLDEYIGINEDVEFPFYENFLLPCQKSNESPRKFYLRQQIE